MVINPRTDPVPVMAKPEFSTWAELLDFRATTTPDQLAYTFLQDGTTPSDRLAYGELASRARSVAARLRQVTTPGDRALLLHPPGLDFIVALFACFEAGVVAVPAYPPGRRGNLHLEAIFKDALPAAVLTTSAIATSLPEGVRQALDAEDRWVSEGNIVCVPATCPQRENGITPDPDPCALLQYTSGSTSTPKGVMVSHHNLLANSDIIRQAFGLSPASVSVSWLPAYHDMGLIDGILQPLYTGFPAHLMPPTAFLKAPIRWLQAISRYRATHSGGPNFAYALCAERTTAADRQGLDLSCWLSAYNGAEPIRPSTLEEFAAAFAPHGFRPQSSYPCYGLAEATLMVTGAELGSGARTLSAATGELSEAGTARAASSGEQATELVSCGTVQGDARVRVVDPTARVACPPGQVGEIWVAGRSVAGGYWKRPGDTEETFGAHLADSGDGPFLRTGDLGFLHDGELFVTGRLKDLIIIRGRNYYPQDLERSVEECHPAVRAGCGAAFAVPGPDAEQLVIVCELTPEAAAHFDGPAIAQAIRRTVTERHALRVDGVALLPTGAIPKTSSGKIRRRESRARYLAETLGELYRDVLTPRETWQGHGTRARETLMALPVDQRKAWLTAYVRDAVLGPQDELPAEHAPSTSLTDVGIDSLAAAELAHHVSGDLGVPVSLTEFLENATAEHIADRLLELVHSAHGADSTAGADSSDIPGSAENPGERPRQAPAPAPSRRPLSHGEQALWFLHTAAPTSPAYNTCYAARLPGSVDADALRGALAALSERHPALRTTFPAVDGKPYAVVHDRMPVPVSHEDTTGLGEQALEQRIIEFRDRPFDVRQGPLIRAMLGKHDEGGHILVLAAHHIVVDLWSLKLILNDLQRSYAAATGRSVSAGGTGTTGAAGDTGRTGKADAGPSATGWTPHEYVHWIRERVFGPAGEQQWRYWAKQLEDVPTTLALPYDRARPAVQEFDGDSVTLPLDDALSTELKALARTSGVTLYTLLLAAYEVLLHRCTGSTDFVVGTPAAARTRPELASLTGYLANQLVLRVKVGDDPTFTDHLARVRETVLGALEHQEFPFPLLVERLRPPRDPSHTPLFQVMFAYEKMPSTAGSVPPLEPIAVRASAARFDLTLACVEEDQGLTTRWEYSTALFDRATIERIGGHFRTLLADIVRDPRERISLLRVLTDAQHEQAVLDWNATAEPVSGATLHELIAAQAARTPDAVAVACRGEELSYRELDRRATALSEHLTRLGARSGTLVAVCLRRRPALLVSLLAVLKSGAAFVPMDPSHPARRLAHVIDDTRAVAVLTQRDVRDRLPDREQPTVCVDEALPESSSSPSAVPDAGPDDLAYVLHTSGSTGTPKGVMVAHRSIVNYLTWANREYRMAEGAGAPVSSSVTFDATLTSLFGPLLAGRTVTLLSEGGEIHELYDLLHGGTGQSLVKATPAQLDLVRAVIPADAPQANVGALVVGGEAFPAESLAFWRRHAPGARIFNEYGPTEATVGCCVYEAVASAPGARRVPIGRPIANAEMYVLDRNRRIVPVGVPGEIHIGGTGLARGYLNRPDLTEERFIPHPFRDEPGTLLYRSGDRARYLADGTIDYLGRDDDQVKIRGARIELGELEAVLLDHPDVREAAVTAAGGRAIDRRLTAHIVAAPGAGAGLDDRLRSFVSERVPSYMVPTDYVLTGGLPRSAHGKVDRAALRESLPEETGRAVPSPSMPDTEREVAAVWQEVLRVSDMGHQENFFDLGGTSALAAEIQARLSHRLNREISMVTLFQHPTISSLARTLAGPPADGSPRHDSEVTDRAQRRAQALRRRNKR
ncbi:non-ribosomal peptide synthetase [Streptomyces sp. CC224B]|uniref:non-ribosomal peptide synthetase n=1 Tax=Streptomyces sp. CC224B TaxID=3044571 RepID=UPI0024A8225D|nr:non-ribosomal peptide synthetase [Streptomyces sp. CC224B]